MAKRGNDYGDTTNLAYFTVELDNTHPVPVSWNSDDPSTGYARVLIDLETKEILKLEMVVDGMYATGDPDTQNLLQQNFTTVQPFHFHNVPQGGDKFFVQQLFDTDPGTGEITTATLENTDTGFRFAIDEAYELRPPFNDANRAEFVMPEILDGNGYIGIHTELFPVGATALAGEINVFGHGSLDGKIKWFDDGRDVGIGSKKNDLLSMGGGDDFANGKASDDVIDGGAGNDRLFGKRGNDELWGGDDDDLLVGGQGDDNLFGNRGDDDLRGGVGDDELDGGFGADILNGGLGDDLLTGGEDADIFRFDLFSGSDTITDYDADEDVLLFAGPQRVLNAQLADVDGVGGANDTVLTLIGGDVSVLNVDLTADYSLA